MKRRISLLFHLKWHQCTETLNITGNSITLNDPKCSALCSLKKYFLYRFTFTRRVIPLTCLCGVSLFHYCWCRCCKRQHCQPGYRPKQETNMTIYIWPGKLRSLRTCRQVLLLIEKECRFWTISSPSGEVKHSPPLSECPTVHWCFTSVSITLPYCFRCLLHQWASFRSSFLYSSSSKICLPFSLPTPVT